MIYWVNNVKGFKHQPLINFLAGLSFIVQLSAASDQKAGHGADDLPMISSAPTEISSDTMDFDVEKRTAVFLGNVLVVDDKLRLNSDKMIVQFDENNKLKNIEALGNVVIDSDGNIAESGKAVYDLLDGTVVLSIDPILMQGDNRVVGAEKIIFSRKTEKFITEGGSPHIIFYESDTESKFSDLFKKPEKKED